MLATKDDFRRDLLKWYDRHQRELPWRKPREAKAANKIGPYHILVSETMLQQTQVGTVLDFYQRFIARFPTVQSLAQAAEQEVLRLWQGLGYYSRARNLQAAAQSIVRDHGGQVPSDLKSLLALPGVGRYTAGAIASIAFDQRAAILDGNVARVLCRIDAILDDPRQTATRNRLWQRAQAILPSKRCGDFNSAIMDLGATICTPSSPQCQTCPVARHCQAMALDIQNQIPVPRKTKAIPIVHRFSYLLNNGHRWLMEQRPGRGRWAGLWQFVTLGDETTNETADPLLLLQSKYSLPSISLVELGRIRHALTHRQYIFQVYAGTINASKISLASHQRWLTLEEVNDYPLSRPQLRMKEWIETLPLVTKHTP